MTTTRLLARRGAVDPAPVLPTAVAWWKASTYSGSGNLLDGSGNGHDLTINGAAFANGAFTFVASESDYMETADHADLDFGTTDNFTVAIALKVSGAPGAATAWMAKRTATSTTAPVGWNFYSTSGSLIGRFTISDGTNRPEATKSSIVANAPTLLAGVRDVSADTITAALGGVIGSAVTDSTTGTLVNAEVVRIGRLSGAGTSYADMTFYGAAVFRRALAAGELATLAAELGVG